MWNHYMHLEAYFGVPVVGGVLHTLNLRLHPDELAYIVNHADDRFLIVDDVLLPIFERSRISVNLERVIVTPFGGGDRSRTATRTTRRCCSESSGEPAYADLDEARSRRRCATPRAPPAGPRASSIRIGRSRCTHSRFRCRTTSRSAATTRCCRRCRCFTPTPGALPHAAVMNGSHLVFPGPNLQPERILDLLSTNQVTLTGGVPTIWLGVLDALERQPGRWRLRPGRRAIIGGGFGGPGNAVPRLRPLRRSRDSTLGHDGNDSHGHRLHAEAAHGPAGPTTSNTRCARSRDCRRRSSRSASMGDDGEVPWDGQHAGRAPGARARGWRPATTSSREESSKWTEDGWFRTGDVATIDPEGYVKITDRDQGPDQVGRRVDQLGRPGERAGRPPGGRRSRGHRGAGSEVAGAAAGGRRAEAGMHGDATRSCDVPRRARSRSGSCRMISSSCRNCRTRRQGSC